MRPAGKRGGAVIEYRRDPLFGIIEYRNGNAAPEVVFEALPGWPLPTELAKLAMSCAENGQGERILPAGIVERFVQNTDGTRSPLTEGSTKPVAAVVHHAGITKVKRYDLHPGLT
jgi:hypothetical protein